MSTRILIVDDDELNLKLVASSLEKEGYELALARNGEEALELIKQHLPELAILDVMLPDIDGYTLCQQIRSSQKNRYTAILMLTALTNVSEKIKGFESGADDFMAKPFQPLELRARVKALLRHVERDIPADEPKLTAKTIAVFSLRGGAGVSMLAANLASSLTQIWGMPAALVDLALVNGQAAVMLDMPLRNTWTDIGRSPVAEIDGELLDHVMLKHSSGVHILAAPPSPEASEGISPDHVQHALELLRRKFHYVVLDLPHDFSELTLHGLDMADEILLLFSPELASIRCASAALSTFASLHYSLDKVSLVLNWTFKGSGLPRQDMENALDRKINKIIPNAGDQIATSITLGKPPVLQFPLTPLGAFLEDLAYSFSKEEHRRYPPHPAGEGLKRVKERARESKAP
jgi:pilus assembly protein CpaE